MQAMRCTECQQSGVAHETKLQYCKRERKSALKWCRQLGVAHRMKLWTAQQQIIAIIMSAESLCKQPTWGSKCCTCSIKTEQTTYSIKTKQTKKPATSRNQKQQTNKSWGWAGKGARSKRLEALTHNISFGQTEEMKIETCNQRFCFKLFCWWCIKVRKPVSWAMINGFGFVKYHQVP